jgi:fumarate hydratase class I
MMNPSDSIVDWVLEMLPDGCRLVPAGHAGHRHRRHGGTLRAAGQEGADGADRHGPAERARAPDRSGALRIEIFDKVNALGIGAQGLGGLATILDVKIMDAPCHAAGKPVAMIPTAPPPATRISRWMAAARFLETPKLDEWPQVHWAPDAAAKRVNLDTLTAEEVQGWKQGDRLLLNGKMLTGRDAAHKRIQDMLAKGENCRSISRAA